MAKENAKNRICVRCRFFKSNNGYSFCCSSLSENYMENVYPDDKCNVFCRIKRLTSKDKKKKKQKDSGGGDK